MNQDEVVRYIAYIAFYMTKDFKLDEEYAFQLIQDYDFEGLIKEGGEGVFHQDPHYWSTEIYENRHAKTVKS